MFNLKTVHANKLTSSKACNPETFETIESPKCPYQKGKKQILPVQTLLSKQCRTMLNKWAIQVLACFNRLMKNISHQKF